MNQSTESKEISRFQEVNNMLIEKDWLSLSRWLAINNDGGKILLPLLGNLNVQPPKNFVAHTLSRLP